MRFIVIIIIIQVDNDCGEASNDLDLGIRAHQAHPRDILVGDFASLCDGTVTAINAICL
jgi:hypothetical protein